MYYPCFRKKEQLIIIKGENARILLYHLPLAQFPLDNFFVCALATFKGSENAQQSILSREAHPFIDYIELID